MKIHICPKCKSEFQRVTKGACPLCKTSLKKVEGTFLLESEARIPELLLQNYEINASNAKGVCFSFTRGKERSAQLVYAVNFFQKTREWLGKQSTPIKATPESFALMVLAEIMTPSFSKSTHSIRGLNSFINNACTEVYTTKVAEQEKTVLYHSLDLSPSFEVKVF